MFSATIDTGTLDVVFCDDCLLIYYPLPPSLSRVWRINYKENVLYVQGNAVQGPVGSLLQICDSKLPVRHLMFIPRRFRCYFQQYC